MFHRSRRGGRKSIWVIYLCFTLALNIFTLRYLFKNLDTRGPLFKTDTHVISNAIRNRVNAVGGNSYGGLYDGKTMKIRHQIKRFPKSGNPRYFKYHEEIPDRRFFNSWAKYIWPIHIILLQLGFKYAENDQPVHIWLTRRFIPQDIQEGYQIINSMGISNCIGGSKAQQLKCRREFSRYQGCKYEDLKIQPIQFDMLNETECLTFFAFINQPENADKVYISKPSMMFHGDGMNIYHGPSVELQADFGNCKKKKNYILMEYIANPALMDGYKYDLRSFMLVASIKPMLLFYHDGIVRRASTKYSVHSREHNVHIMNSRNQTFDDHFYNFSTASIRLKTEHGLASTHFDHVIRPRMKEISKFVFLSENWRFNKDTRRRVGGRFHLFAFDWALDSKGNVYLLEGNKFPIITNYPADLLLTPMIWKTMIQLILQIHTEPNTLPNSFREQDKYHYYGWDLIYNELESKFETVNGISYNVCQVFNVSH